MTTKMLPITAKLRADEKSEFIRIADSIGTTPSNAIRMFISAFNKRGGFPFDPSNPYGFNDETLAAMDDAVNKRNLLGSFKSTDEMWKAVFDEDDNA
ncbi:MAG: type II toxin-antitoxin system RelB/DinJ family antitoxin [Coriobacteriia bacterium]|nr:type II toxin-antitoxin system RelB/DinJ family antitoxin [Coriobacteriia bacterium]